MSAESPTIDREALVADALPVVRHIARQIARELPPWVPFDDLASAGREGLVQAAHRFDATRGVPFVSFAWYRVRGAIFDHVRRACSDDPEFRARLAAQVAVDDLIERATEPSAGHTEDTALEAASQLALVLEDAAAAFTLAEMAAQTTPLGTDPETSVMRAETMELLLRALDQLPSRERDLLSAVYLQGRSIESAGTEMGLGKSWTSRLHARALALVREALADVADGL